MRFDIADDTVALAHGQPCSRIAEMEGSTSSKREQDQIGLPLPLADGNVDVGFIAQQIDDTTQRIVCVATAYIDLRSVATLARP